jgi:hypothetical protein
MGTDNPHQSPQEERLRLVLGWVIVTAVTLFSFVLVLMIRKGFYSTFYSDIASQHFAATVGLPMGAVAALFIVLVLRATSGPLEFEAIGLKFKGASGPIVLWLMCFLGIAAAIKWLW